MPGQLDCPMKRERLLLPPVCALAASALLLALLGIGPCLPGLAQGIVDPTLPLVPIPDVVTVEATDPEAAEPARVPPGQMRPTLLNPALFTVTRTGPNDFALPVQYHLEGSAQNGVDYEFLSGLVVIPAGSTTALITVTPFDDGLVELTETVAVVLDSPICPAIFPPPRECYQLGSPFAAKAVLLDNGEGAPPSGPVVNLVATDDSATEPPTSDPSISKLVDRGTFTVTRTGGDLSLPMLVFFGLEGTASEGIDYAPLGSTVWIPAGASSVELPVIPWFDTLKEGDESVVVRLYPSPIIDPAGPGGVILPVEYYDVGSNSVATVTIHDNSLSTGNLPPKADIVRPVSGSVYTAPAAIEIVVQTADADGYVPFVEFFAGTQRIGESRITWIRKPDPGTLVTHSFSWGNVQAGDYLLTAVAHDDLGATTTTAPVAVHVDPWLGTLPRVTVSATDPEAAEPTPLPPGMGLAIRPNVAVFTLHRTGGDLNRPLAVHYHMEGTARNGVDYAYLPGLVVIPESVSDAEVTVVPMDDDLVEGTETIDLVIDPVSCPKFARFDPTCYTVGDPGAAEAKLLDNDPDDSLPPVIHLYATDPIASEGQPVWGTREAVFILHRTGRTNEAVTVGLQVSGTATPGLDYESLPGSVTLPAGERRAKLVLVPIDDKIPEGMETVRLELLPPPAPAKPLPGWPAYRLEPPYRAEALILDDDHPLPPSLHLPDGMFHVCLPIPGPGTYEVEVSPDLKTWAPAGPANPIAGILHYIDPEVVGPSGKFYRLAPAGTTTAP